MEQKPSEGKIVHINTQSDAASLKTLPGKPSGKNLG